MKAIMRDTSMSIWRIQGSIVNNGSLEQAKSLLWVWQKLVLLIRHIYAMLLGMSFSSLLAKRLLRPLFIGSDQVHKDTCAY